MENFTEVGLSRKIDMNEHIPSLTEVRTHWGIAVDHYRRPERLAEFDRMIAEIKAEAAKETEDKLKRLEVLEDAFSRIEEVMQGHPTCDKYSEDDVISCGWKSAYASVQYVLDSLKTEGNNNYY